MGKSDVGYAPAPVPEDTKLIKAYLDAELVKIQAAIAAATATHFNMLYAPPDRYEDGDVIYADGSSWNPGSGKGLYYYKSGTGWVFIA